MTRYANLKRNADIVAIYHLGIPPKQIPRQLKDRYPDVTIHVVYHVLEMFQVERSCEILRNQKGEKTSSNV